MSDEPRDGTEFPPAPDPYDGGEAPPPPPPPADEPPAENLPPWENRERYDLLSGFVNTIPQALTAPGRFFEGHPVRRGLWGPLTFGVLVGVIAALAEWMWSRVFSGFEDTLYELLGEEHALSAQEEAIVSFIEGTGLFLTPVFVVVFLLVVAGAVHVAVKLVSSQPDAGFEATFRAVAYGSAGSILSLVPVCGDLIGTVWGLVITLIGVRELHGMNTGQALIAVLAPLLLCCCGFGAFMVMVAGMASL